MISKTRPVTATTRDACLPRMGMRAPKALRDHADCCGSVTAAGIRSGVNLRMRGAAGVRECISRRGPVRSAGATGPSTGRWQSGGWQSGGRPRGHALSLCPAASCQPLRDDVNGTLRHPQARPLTPLGLNDHPGRAHAGWGRARRVAITPARCPGRSRRSAPSGPRPARHRR